jgi:hypothetical protein
MAATMSGKAVVFSIGGITYTAGLVTGTNAGFIQSQSFGRTADKVDVKNQDGAVAAQCFSGFKKTISHDIIPAHASTIAGAKASLEAHMLKPGTLMTIVDADGTTIDGNYNLISCEVRRVVDGLAVASLSLEGSDEGVDFTTAVT